MRRRPGWLLWLTMLGVVAGLVAAEPRRIVVIAGHASHGPGDHEFRAGALLLQACLADRADVEVTVHDNDWPADPDAAFAGADAIIVYSDGNAAHPLHDPARRERVRRAVAAGAGIGFMHFALGVDPDDLGPLMQDWVGAYYQSGFSANPIWEPQWEPAPPHPVRRGVGEWSARDEWYFHLRFREDDVGTITPLLWAKPGAEVRAGPYVYPQGPYPHVMANLGRREVVMWAYDRPDGGRGFGFTGGHKHAHWGNAMQRRIVLNAWLWVAGAEVPAGGVVSNVSKEQLAANLDSK